MKRLAMKRRKDVDKVNNVLTKAKPQINSVRGLQTCKKENAAKHQHQRRSLHVPSGSVLMISTLSLGSCFTFMQNANALACSGRESINSQNEFVARKSDGELYVFGGNNGEKQKSCAHNLPSGSHEPRLGEQDAPQVQRGAHCVSTQSITTTTTSTVH